MKKSQSTQQHIHKWAPGTNPHTLRCGCILSTWRAMIGHPAITSQHKHRPGLSLVLVLWCARSQSDLSFIETPCLLLKSQQGLTGIAETRWESTRIGDSGAADPKVSATLQGVPEHHAVIPALGRRLLQGASAQREHLEVRLSWFVFMRRGQGLRSRAEREKQMVSCFHGAVRSVVALWEGSQLPAMPGACLSGLFASSAADRNAVLPLASKHTSKHWWNSWLTAKSVNHAS